MTNDPGVRQALADLDSADLGQRIDALHRLRALTDEQIAPRLIPLLRDTESIIRRLAAEALGKNGDSKVVQALIDTLFDPQPDVRVAVVDALGQIGDHSAVPALIEALYDEDVEVRFAATEALRLLEDPRAVVDLINVMDKDDPPLSAMAAMALHRIGTPEALAAIQHLREGDHYNFDFLDVPEPEASYAEPDETQVTRPAPSIVETSPESDATLRHIPPAMLQDFLEEDVEPDVTRRSAATTQAESAANPVQFSAYYPREVVPNLWQPLRAYVFVPSAAQAVAADAQQELGALLPLYRDVERPAQGSIAQGALITATPELKGFQFNPPSAQAGFYDDFERFDFKLRAVDAPLDEASNGRITFTVEGVIVADIPLSIYVGESVPSRMSAPASATVTRPIYQSIFCSYSHKDTQIIEHVERAYKALGMTFLRDVVTLKSGQDWDEQLLRLIDQADIFQLFWSDAAAESSAVRKEWTHALNLKRQGDAFIRPVYWQQPMPPPAPELAAIHFAYEPDLAQA